MTQDLRPKRKRADSSQTVHGEKKRQGAAAEPEADPDEVRCVSEELDASEGVNLGGEDENDWGGIPSEDEKKSEVTGARQDSENVNKPPTSDELRSINEASELYKSNTFKLAIDALLPNVRPKEPRIKPLDEFLRILYTTLMSLSSTPPSHPLEAARALSKQGVAVPYAAPQPAEDTAWKVAFERPSDIIVVGSWATKTGVKSSSSTSWTVDVAVEMPVSLFQEKDYLDYRFFHKRAYYLAFMASAIHSDEKLRVDAFYDTPPSGVRLTSLVLVPRNDGSPTDFSKLNARVRLLPVLPSPCPVSLHHLSPAHCNLRVKSSGGDAGSSTGASPIYNTDLMMCTSARERLLRTHKLVQDVPSLRDALALLRVWANQRGYGPGPKDRGVVAGFERKGYFWTVLMHAIVIGEESFGRKMTKGISRRTVGRGLSSYQLFRAALDFLAKHDFSSEPIFVKGGSRFSPDSYGSHSAVFVDTCSVNLLADIPLTSLDLLRQDAKITLDLLNCSSASTKVDPFDDVFLRDRRQLMTRFDVVLCIDLRRASLRKSRLLDTLDHGSPAQLILHTLSRILRRALGDRVHAIAIIVPPSEPRPLLKENAPVPLTKIHVGLILNTDNAFRLVDHGPAASEQDSKEAIDFRDLWGTKAELRRFKDGRIAESVVWEVKSMDARARIPADIVNHVLSRHLSLDTGQDVQAFQKGFDDFLHVPDALAQRLVLPGAQPGFKSAMAAFDNLVRQLKGLDEEVPLSILNVSPVSSDLRYTSVFTPTPVPPKAALSLSSVMRYLRTMEIVLQFERSGRWPDDLAAIQKMKLAFFEQIASALMTKVPGLKASIVTGNRHTTPSVLDSAYLEIVTSDGWAFAARIWHDREATLLDRLLDKRRKTFVTKGNASASDSKVPERFDKQFALEAYELYAQRYVHAPKHHRAVASMCHRFPAFSGTVRLVKRWFAAHWILEGHISGEAVELLCALIFVGSGKGALQRGEEGRVDVPATKELGFFRVLALLKEWAWETGLFVSLYETDDDAEDGDGATVHVKTGSGRGVWIISTGEDRSGRVWTAEGPDAVVARRIKMLASASTDHVVAHERDGLIPRTLFLHPTDDYDILIRLKSDVLCRTHQSLDAAEAVVKRYANIPVTSAEDDEPLRVDFDPALMYFNDLKRIFSGTLAFFFDPYGGSVIGAVWDPSLLAARPFRVLADYSTTPLDTDEKRKQKATVVLNQASVLAEIQRLGEGLVKSIEVQRAHS